jgi:GT2 family glycosyltransferase
VKVAPVSVVIPTYQRARLCIEAVKSALSQTLPPAEVIVVDDGSTDDTAKLVSELGEPVRYLYQDNSERGAARNRGVEASSNDFVAFLDSDDLWHRRHLEWSMRAFEEYPDAAYVFGRAIYVTADGKPLMPAPTAPVPEGIVDPFVAVKAFARRAIGPPHSSVVVRREILREHKFKEDRYLARAEDFELWLRIAALYPIVFTGKPSAFLRVEVGNTSREAEAAYRAMTAALKEIESNPWVVSAAGDQLQYTRAYVALECARLFARAGSRRLALELTAEALRNGAGRACPQEIVRLAALVIAPPFLAEKARTLLRTVRSKRVERTLKELGFALADTDPESGGQSGRQPVSEATHVAR